MSGANSCEGGCTADGGPSPIGYAEALRCFERRAVPVQGTERVALQQAQGRILAQDIAAPRDVPAFDNAAVDGVAFAWSARLEGGGTLELLSGRSAAGHAFSDEVKPGHAVRILTGAPLPAGTDTVAAVEACSFSGGQVSIPEGLKAGANRRIHGEDVSTGRHLLARGARLGPWEIAVAAALGLGEITVHRRPRVALFSTGDELLPPGAAWRKAGVYDTNRPLLHALLAQLPVDVHDHGIVGDDRGRIGATLDKSDGCDLILGSGGASRGDEDHVASLLAERGSLDFWRVAMRPGRPLALGSVGDAACVALPGNPVAAASCFLRFVRPLLLALAGAAWHVPPGRSLPAAFAMEKKQGRTELLRCRVVRDQGTEMLQPVTRQGSGMLSTLLEADGIAELDADRAQVAQGDALTFLSWQELGLS
ncbi:molybdopterin molybdotransferase MoeA [Geminicoccus roseus]|uniref:molybdopterin molybdotransferase MoeA n=1 Tax=Geminicoccus roseus TaxID=404900 RepID=UPI000417348D|nr:gephyrin-like molybdotransferase Glp [Geminicoccus roseus]